jgi:hypothetical protein
MNITQENTHETSQCFCKRNMWRTVSHHSVSCQWNTKRFIKPETSKTKRKQRHCKTKESNKKTHKWAHKKGTRSTTDQPPPLSWISDPAQSWSTWIASRAIKLWWHVSSAHKSFSTEMDTTTTPRKGALTLHNATSAVVVQSWCMT